MGKKGLVITYILFDFVAAAAVWVLFYMFRKKYIESAYYPPNESFYDEKLFLGLALIPFFWIILYAAAGSYKNVYRKYRLKEFGQTLFISILGTLIIFFFLILDDYIGWATDADRYKNYYRSLLTLFLLHFGITVVLRLILTTRTVKKIHRREIGFNTLIIGGNERALAIYNEIESIKNSPGYKFVGFLSTNGVDRALVQSPLQYFGKYDRLEEIISAHNIEEVIIAIESSEHKDLRKIINDLEIYDVNVKIIPDMYDILTGQVKMTSIFGTPLIQVNQQIMPPWQVSVKRLMDIGMSLFALVVLSPLYLFLMIAVKLSSKGPVFFKQERIGIHGKPFMIIKFRSMYVDAEENGPQLSSENDNRITPIGRFMRKTRMDELPQFWNVLKGDMSVVGPRPERQYYIDKITERAEHYRHLHKVRPGITSWGQVKYGYAENVDEMIQRLKYDILYIENMSIGLDLKILIYTILIVFKGSGK